MNKKILFTVLVVSSLFIGGALIFSVLQEKNPKDVGTQNTTGTTLGDKLKEKELLKDLQTEEDKPKTKIEQLRKKYALRGLIIEANTYYSNDQFALALKNYLSVYDQVGDKVTAERVADTYFKMQKFSLAYKYYNIVGDTQSKEKAFLSLMYSSPLALTGSIDPLVKELEATGFGEEKKFFYTTSLQCIHDFHGCKKAFADYFPAHTSPLETKEMQTIQTTLQNYENFKLEDVTYKDALITGAFYELGLYPIVVELGNSILGKQPDYKPVILMVGQSYYELGLYNEAKSVLARYKEIEPNDKNATYLLGVINLKLHEYILSNILLNKALELGYEPSINVHRRLAFNYEILGQEEKMLGEFSTILKTEKGYEKDDAYLAIYYHIIQDKTPEALELTKLALQKFPNDGSLYGYLAWIYRYNKDLVKAKAAIEKGFSFDVKNPLLYLNLGFLYLEDGKSDEAKANFEKTKELDPNGDFGKQAIEQLSSL